MNKPYQYQIEGAEWLSTRDRALLADEPGLGKSCQTVMGADILRLRDILVIPPATVRFVWKQEIQKWSAWGHDINVITSSDHRPRRNAVNVVNYDLLGRAFEGKVGWKPDAFLRSFKEIDWQLMVGDEASRLKEQHSQRTMAVLSEKGIAPHCQRIWLLDGTPMPNHPGELWVPLVSLGATDMEYKDFINKFCVFGHGSFNKDKPIGTKDEMVPELRKLLRGVMMRRRKEFVLPELPPIRIDDMPIPEIKIKVEEFFEEALADKKNVIAKINEQEDFVREVWKKTISTGGAMTTMDMIAALEALGPSVALYRRWLGAVKAASFLPIIEDELERGEVKKVVIFCHHKQVIAYMKAKLSQFGSINIDGSVSMNGREAAVHRFQNDPTCRVAVCQNHAAGTGITLTAAHEVVSLEQDWVPSVNAQAIMRCHRIGQKSSVRARFVRLADTLDDYISEVLARKTREIVRVVEK